MNITNATPATGSHGVTSSTLTLLTADALCPDLLRYEQIGQADGARGRVVRAFFWLLRWWPTP